MISVENLYRRYFEGYESRLAALIERYDNSLTFYINGYIQDVNDAEDTKVGGGMTYIEYAFVCMAAPLLVAAFCMGKKHYGTFFFCIAGMGTCLLVAYINTFFVEFYNADIINATTQ